MGNIQFIKSSILEMLKNVFTQDSGRIARLKSGFSYEFGIHKMVLWPCGLWPLENQNMYNTIHYLLAILSQVGYH